MKDIAAKVEDLQKQGAKRLVLDLRHCATGGPEQGTKLANLFLDKGLITYYEGQKVQRQDINADAKEDISRLPLVVIVNRRYSRRRGSGCCRAAGRDKRADVVGERHLRRCCCPKTITMDDGSAVILSVAKYYSPSGKAIQDTGVTPSVPVQEIEPVALDDDGNPLATEPQQQPP